MTIHNPNQMYCNIWERTHAHAHIHTHTHTHTHTHAHTHTHTCKHAHITHMHTYAHTRICITYTHAHTCVYTHVHACTYSIAFHTYPRYVIQRDFTSSILYMWLKLTWNSFCLFKNLSKLSDFGYLFALYYRLFKGLTFSYSL